MVNGAMSCGFPQSFLRYYGDSDVTAEGYGQGGQLSPDIFFGGQRYHFPPPLSPRHAYFLINELFSVPTY